MISQRHAGQERVGLDAQLRRERTVLGTPKRVIVSGRSAGHDTLRMTRTERLSPKMKPVAGVWIDRRKAVVAVMSATGNAVTEIHAGIDREPSRYAGVQHATPYEPQLVAADGRQQRGYAKHLGRFYARVVATLGAVHEVFVFGPGEAKGELRKQLDGSEPRDRIISMGAAGAMSMRQFLAKVRDKYHPRVG